MAVQGQFQQNITAAQANAWAQQLEIWMTPWGFLKGAAANNATAKSQTVSGRRFQVRDLDDDAEVARRASRTASSATSARRAWSSASRPGVENPIFGDMLVEAEYTNYRDANGVMYPAKIVQRRGGRPIVRGADTRHRRQSRPTSRRC